MKNPIIATLFLLLLLLLLVFVSNIDGLRILGLVPIQVRSHHVMCEELLRKLASRGHQVDVYGHFPLAEPVTNYTDYDLSGTLPPKVNNYTYDYVRSIGKTVSLFRYLLADSVNSMCKLLDHPLFRKLLSEPPRDPPYDLIILEYSSTNCFVPLGRHLGVPIVGVVTLPTHDTIHSSMGNPNNLAVDPSVFSSHSHPMNFAERLSNFLTHYGIRLTFESILSEQDEYMKAIYGPDCPRGKDVVSDFSLILVNQNLALNGVRPFTPAVVPVGGLHIVDRNESLPREVKKWLDESVHGCVYFSFGSMVRLETFPESVVLQIYKSFENIAPTRVLLRVVEPALLPKNLPSNVMTRPWFPQIQVLKHNNVKAFVTHGGLMGTQEAVHFGVPMVGIPMFADQFLNVDLCVKRRIAVKLGLDEINEASFTRALEKVIGDPSYEESAAKISRQFRDTPMSPIDTAVYWVEYVQRNGKDALRSPLADMPWYQVQQLDIYGFFLVAIITILYTFVKAWRLFVRIICRYSMLNRKKNN